MAQAFNFLNSYDDLISQVLSYTGSTDTEEIQQSIRLAEITMRTIELPQLRSDPWDPAFQLTADESGEVTIPTDMMKPILFFQAGTTANGAPITGDNIGESVGPWIVYDRVGDREILKRYLNDNQFLYPFNIPAVYRGQFSEVGDKYVFLPKLAGGAKINLYYYRVWPFLGSTQTDTGGQTVVCQSNVVLQSFPEGYFYNTLAQYYFKKKNTEEAAKWLQAYESAYSKIADQNSEGKWSGGTVKLFSAWQPRRDRYSYK